MSGFFASQSVSVGSTISGAVAEDIFFGGAGGTLAQDDEIAVKTVAGSKNVRMGGTVTFNSRLTLKGDDTTGNIMQWYFGAKGVLMSCNGLSVTNTGEIPFHVNMSGTCAGFALQEDDHISRTGYSSLIVDGNVTSRTVPVAWIGRSTTPAAGADMLTFYDVDRATKLAKFDKDAKLTVPSLTNSALTAGRIPVVSTAGLFADSANFLWATSGGADTVSLNGAAALGAMNLLSSVSGYFLVVNNTTHYANNKLNFAGDYALEIDAVNAKGRLSEAQGSDVAAANNLVLGTGTFTSGNYYVVTGDVQTNLISSAGWGSAPAVTLHLVPTVSMTVKHNQATSGANTKILLTGAADLIVTVPTNLTLRLTTVGGVLAWRQEGVILPVA